MSALETKSTLYGGSTPMVQEVTYNKIWFGDLERLIQNELEEEFDFRDVMAMSSLGQNSYIIIRPADIAGELEGYDDLEKFVKRLIEKGVLPDNHDLYIDIWW